MGLSMTWMDLELEARRHRRRHALGTAAFLAGGFVLAATAWLGLSRLGLSLFEATIVAMSTPMVAALAVGMVMGFFPRRPALVWGLVRRAFRPSRQAATGAAMTVGMVVAGVGVTYILGLQGPGQGVLGLSPVAIGTGLLIYFLPACAEEFGWRGFLFDRFRHLTPVTAALVVGVCWGLWHAPAVVGSGFDYWPHRLAGVVAICLVTAPFSVILVWLRRSSGSLFAPAVAHATFNALVGPLCFAMAGADSLLAAPMGLLAAVPMWAVAGFLVAGGALDPAAGRPSRQRPQPDPLAATA